MTYRETLYYIQIELNKFSDGRQDTSTTLSHISAYIRG